MLFLRAAAAWQGRPQWRWLPPFAVLVAAAILALFPSEGFRGSLFLVEDALIVLSESVVFAALVTIILLAFGALAQTFFSRAWRHVHWRGFGIKHLLIFTAAAAFTCVVRRSLPANELPFDYLVGLFAVLLLAWLVIHCAVVDFGRDQEPPRKAGHELGNHASPWSELPFLIPQPSETADRPIKGRCLTRLRWWSARRNHSPPRQQSVQRSWRGRRHAMRRSQRA